MSQVLTNLLTNAIKYSDRGQPIEIRTRESDGGVEFEVEDSGIGLSTEQIPTIFEMFAQVAPAIARTEGGLGIGLAVAKALVEMHGGRIEASSAGLGRGSKFTVTLPRVTLPEPKADSASPPAIAERPDEVIVIADDNVDAADSLASLLSLEGYKVFVAHDGLEALQTVEKVRPAACFLDIGMPGLDGFQVAQRLRASFSGSELLLIATTGWGQPEDKRRASEAGFDWHLTKPIDLSLAKRELAARLGRN